jgi:pyruvate dehydrogenase E2 component (dihydrolipoamide acetyltransferase)
MGEFKMPSLGADMTAGTLIAWMKKPGDAVKRGDVIAEVDTDKGVIEVEVFQDGVIEKLLVKEDEKIPVGTVLAIITEAGDGTRSKAVAGIKEEAPPALHEIAKPPLVSEAAHRPGRIHASPVARKLAEQLRVDLKNVKGTGPQGRIQREDVERAARSSEQLKTEGPTGRPATIEPDRNIRMRQAIAAAMARSKREIPHYYLGTTVDMTKALEWLEVENTKRPLKDRILYSVLLLKAVALALRETPELNATWENDRLNLKEKINIGTAISLRQGGLVAPAIKETDIQSLDELMKHLLDLVQRTRAGALRSSELSDSTITVTNIGEQGVETVYGVIYPPQVAIVGFGRVYEDVSVKDGRIIGSRKINATLAADHRASDGHRGSLFLSAIDRLLQQPEKL